MNQVEKDNLLRQLSLDNVKNVEFVDVHDTLIVGQAACAFLNSYGGYIIVILTNTCDVSGLPVDQNISILDQSIASGIIPKALISFDEQFIGDKQVCIIEVPAGKDIPYSYNSEFYVFEGKKIKIADRDTVVDMVIRRQIAPERWERRFSDVNLDTDLDEKEILRTVQKFNDTARVTWAFDSTMNPVDVLERLGMIKYGRITNAGDVLFTLNPAKRLPQVRLRAACYINNKSSDTYSDYKQFEGALIPVFNQVLVFITRNTSSKSYFSALNPERKDECIYPINAIREGLINAFAHRDYASFMGGIIVHIYPERLEIWNSGNLPDGITPDSLFKTTRQLSILRNPDIAHILYLQNYMEKLGRGSAAIIDECSNAGLPSPNWNDDPDQGVTLTFFAPEGNGVLADRYHAILKEELGYIRMVGLPGVESVKINLNDDTFVPLRISGKQVNELFIEENCALQGDVVERILYPDDIIKYAFKKRRMLLVIGDPGAGKTTLLKYYALCTLDKNHYKRLGFSNPVCVFYLPLRDLVRHEGGKYISLSENLSLWVEKYHITLSAQFFDEWLQSGTALILLDGLDEISDIEERRKVCSWIDFAWSGFRKAYFVVTSRASGYNKDEGIEIEADYEQVHIQDFTFEQQEQFLRKWFTAAFLKESCEKGVDEASWYEKQKEKADNRTTKIMGHLNIETNKGLRQLSSIPMILQIMAILWKDEDYMPESRVKLYEAALDYILEFRDKRRGVVPQLSARNARGVLAPISLWMHTLKKDEVAKADMYLEMQKLLDTLDNPPTAEEFCKYLVKRVGLLIEIGDKEYRFRHKSFREYLAGFQLKENRPYEHLNDFVSHFGDDWWNETFRFFIASVDANVFDAFMGKLIDSPQSDSLTQKQQLFLQTIIEEAPQKKVDVLCIKLLDPITTANRQRLILDCLKAIGKPIALDTLREFREKKLAKDKKDIYSRTEEVILALGGQPLDLKIDKSVKGMPSSFRNQNEHNAEYILVQGGTYIFSVTKNEAFVESLYVAKYPVTNKLYRSFISSLQSTSSSFEINSIFTEKLHAIAENNAWGETFSNEFNRGKNDLSILFRSEFDEDRKFGGEDQPVVGITWYAAQAYCLWLSLYDGDKSPYRLPTEIEWEWVAGGRWSEAEQKVRPYPWDEERGQVSEKLANYNDKVGATTPVGSYPEGATPEGLYDMAGNVWEWTDSYYDEETFLYHAVRGGSWYSNAENCRNDYREWYRQAYESYTVGFRVVHPVK